MGVQNCGCPRRISGQRGQNVVELALALPLLLLLLLGLIDLARGVMLYNTVSTAAREGARFGIVLTDPAWTTFYGKNPFDVDGNKPGSFSAAAFPETTNIVSTVASRMAALDPATTTVKVEYYTTDFRAPIKVTVSYPFTPVVTYILGGSSIPLQASAQMMFE